MKEIQIAFEDTIPVEEQQQQEATVKETPIDFEQTVSQRIPWYQTLWKQVSAFGTGLTTLPEALQMSAAGIRFEGSEETHKRLTEQLSKSLINEQTGEIDFFKEPSFFDRFKFNKLKKTLKQVEGAKQTIIEAQGKMAEKAQKAGITEQTERAFNIGSAASRQLTGLGLAFVNPALGGAVMTASSMSQTYTDLRSRGFSHEKARLIGKAAGAVEITLGQVNLDLLLNPGKSFVSSIVRNILSEEFEELLTETIQIGLEQKLLSTDMTLNEAIERLKEVGINTAILSALMTGASYPIIKNAQYKVNETAEAAKSTMRLIGQDIDQPLLEDPKSLSLFELEDIIDNYKTPDRVLEEKAKVHIKPREEAFNPTIEEALDNQLKLFEEIEANSIEEVFINEIDAQQQTSIENIPPDGSEETAIGSPKKGKISQFRTNTIERTVELTEQTKRELIPDAFRYQEETSSEWEAKARRKLEEDPIGTTKDLFDPNKPIDAEGVYAAAIIAKDMQNRIDTPEGWSEYLDFMKIYAAKVREAAKTLGALRYAWDKEGSHVWVKTSDPTAYLKNVLDFIEEAKNKYLENKWNRHIKEDFEAEIQGVTDKQKIQEIRKKYNVPYLPDEKAKQIYDIWSKVSDLPETNIKRKMAANRIKYILNRIIAPSQSKIWRANDKLREFTNGTLMSTLDSLVWVNFLSNFERGLEETILPNLYAQWRYKDNPEVQKAIENEFKGQLEAIRQMFLYNPIVGEILDPATGKTVRIKGKTFAETLDNINELFSGKDLREGIRLLEDFLEATEYEAINSQGGDSKSDFYSKNRLLGSDPDDPTTWLNTLWDLATFVCGRAPGHLNRIVDNGYKQIYAYGIARREVGFRAVEEAGALKVSAIEYEAKLWDDVLKFFKGEPNPMTPEQQKIVEDIYNKAIKEAEYMTGQQEAGPITQEVIGLLNKIPFSRELIGRFIKTPVNWIKYHVWESMPYSQMLIKYQRDILLGKRGTPYEQTMAKAKFAIGTVKLAAMLALCSTFTVTGKHVSKEKQERFKAQIPEESIYNPFTKTWWNYGRYEWGRPLSVIATLMDNIKHFPVDKQEEWAGAIFLTLISMGDAGMGSIALQDVGNLYKALAPDYYAETAWSWENYYLKQQSKAFMPLSGFLKSIQRGSIGIGKDKYYREINTVLDQLIGVYAPQKLNPKLHNITGEVLENLGSFAGARVVESYITKHPGLLKIYQLGLAIGDAPEELYGYKFTKDEYWEYRRLIDTEGKLAQKLDALVTQEGFDDLPRAIQERLIRNTISSTRLLVGLRYLNKIQKFQEGILQRTQAKLKDLMRSTGKLPDLSDPKTTIDFLNFYEE